MKTEWTIIKNGPEQYYIVKSGWDDKYHLIYEDPEEGDYFFEHHFLNRQDMITKYPFTKKYFEEE